MACPAMLFPAVKQMTSVLNGVRLTASDAVRSFPEKQANCEGGDGLLVVRPSGMPAVESEES